MKIEIVFIRIILDYPKGQEATQTWNNDHIFRVREAHLRPQRGIRRGGARAALAGSHAGVGAGVGLRGLEANTGSLHPAATAKGNRYGS